MRIFESLLGILSAYLQDSNVTYPLNSSQGKLLIALKLGSLAFVGDNKIVSVSLPRTVRDALTQDTVILYARQLAHTSRLKKVHQSDCRGCR